VKRETGTEKSENSLPQIVTAPEGSIESEKSDKGIVFIRRAYELVV